MTVRAEQDALVQLPPRPLPATAEKMFAARHAAGLVQRIAVVEIVDLGVLIAHLAVGAHAAEVLNRSPFSHPLRFNTLHGSSLRTIAALDATLAARAAACRAEARSFSSLEDVARVPKRMTLLTPGAGLPAAGQIELSHRFHSAAELACLLRIASVEQERLHYVPLTPAESANEANPGQTCNRRSKVLPILRCPSTVPARTSESFG